MSASPVTDQRTRFAALDGWRGICAVLVALYHFHALGHAYDLPIVRHAYLFVDFFFVLSGVVISHAYAERLRNGGQFRSFVVWRVARFWPLHVAVLCLLVAIEIAKLLAIQVVGLEARAPAFDAEGRTAPAAILTNLAMVHALGVHDRLTWNAPSWSISAEFAVNLLFGLIVLALHRTTIAMAALLCGIGALVVMVWSDRLMDATFDLGFFRCLFGFFAGHLVYKLAPRGAGPMRYASASELAAVGLVLVFVAVAGGTALSFAAPIVFALAVAIFMREGGVVSAVLKARPFAALGVWSYAIYMVHAVAVDIITRLVSVVERTMDLSMLSPIETPDGAIWRIDPGSMWAADLLVVAYLLIVIGTAAVCHRYIEMPAQRWIRERFSKAGARSAHSQDGHAGDVQGLTGRAATTSSVAMPST